MTEDFALVDFALVAAAPERAVQALGQVHALQARASRAARRGGPAPARGLLARLRGRGAGGPTAPLLIQPEGHLPPPPLARLLADDLGFGAGETPFRVTAPIGAAELVLVEFRDADGETSPVAAALSAELPGQEVFRFRLSGARHPGAETAFHVYLDGRAVRRAASISPQGTAPEAEWRVVDAGIPHPVEADSLPHDRARAWEVMTPARLGAILAAMGVEADALFSPAPGRVSLALSAAPGGAPLSTAARLLRPAPPAPTGPPSPAPTDPAGPEPGGEAAADTARRDGAPAADAPGDGAWEGEVTDILVAAVAHALPQEQQVPWLTDLTARLERGDVDGALAEAHALIARGDRPEAERAADAARFDALFGRERR